MENVSLSLSLSLSRLRFYLFCFLDKLIVVFVRWFWAPFFSHVVFAVGALFVTSVSDVLPVVKGRFRLFDEVFEAIELAIHCSGYRTGDLYLLRYLHVFDDIFHDA